MTVAQEFVALAPEGTVRAGHGSHPCQGVYHHPAGERPTTAFIAAHYEIDFTEHYLAPFLAERGFGFLGWNTRFRGNGEYFRLEAACADIAAGVAWLRDAGVRTIVLLGNSGGASLMAAYQARAHDGADGFVSLCAHPGRPEVLTAWMDPSVVDESAPEAADPALDMYDPANGPPYDDGFLRRYRDAQRERNERITRWASAELARRRERGLGDRLFCVYRTWADPRFLDLRIDPSEREPGCYAGDPRRANYGAFGLAVTTTLRTWLEMWSLAESGCRGGPNMARVRCPSLVIQSTSDQGCYPSDAQAIHDALGADDKRLELVAGDHYLLDPQDARDRVADLIADWLRERPA